MTAAVPVSRQWSREAFYFAYIRLKDIQLTEPLIVDLLEALPIGESLSPRKKGFFCGKNSKKASG